MEEDKQNNSIEAGEEKKEAQPNNEGETEMIKTVGVAQEEKPVLASPRSEKEVDLSEKDVDEKVQKAV